MELLSSVAGALATALVGFIGWLAHRFIKGVDTTTATATLAVSMITKADASATRAHERISELFREKEKHEEEVRELRDRIIALEARETRKAV